MGYEYEGAMGLNVGDIASRITGCPADRATANIIGGVEAMEPEAQQRLATWYEEQGCTPRPDSGPGAWCCDGEHRAPAELRAGSGLVRMELPSWVPFVAVGVVGLIVVAAVVAPAVSGATGAYMMAPAGRKGEALWKGALVGLGSRMAAGAALQGTPFEGVAGAAPFAAGAYVGSEMEEDKA
jgi:hypothetical protein